MAAPEPTPPALRRLEEDGLLRRSEEGWRTTRRLQGAIARAAASLAMTEGARRDEEIDLRRPLALALMALYGQDTLEEVLVEMIEVLLPIEARELAPVPRAGA